MSIVTPFHYRYSHGTQRLMGGDQNLGLELEQFGTPLEPEPPWNQGPVVWLRRSTGTTLVAWVRALRPEDVFRAAAWEAWGVELSDERAVARWPYMWNELRQEPTPKGLQRLARSFENDPATGLPILTANVGVMVNRAYIDFLDDQSVQVPLSTPADLTILPWLWLFGPQTPGEATLIPPRAAMPGTRPLPTYVPRTDLDIPDDRFVSEPVQTILDHAAAKRWKKAYEAAEMLRRMPVEERRAVLTGESVTAGGGKRWATLDRESARPSAGHKSKLRLPPLARLSFDRTLLVATFIAALVGALGSWRETENTSSDTAKTSTTAGTSSDTTDATSMPDTTTGPVVTNTVTAGDQIRWETAAATALRRSPAKSLDNRVKAVINKPQGDLTAGDRLCLRIAALQLYLRSKDKYAGKIDARTDKNFWSADTALQSEKVYQEMLVSDDAIGKWAANYQPQP